MIQDLNHTAVLIPARRMETGLEPMVRALSDTGFEAIVIVNDGMTATDDLAFANLIAIPRVHLLRHAVNLGKGRALKTGLNYLLNEFPDVTAVVTADADGQHSVTDIVRIARELLAKPRSVVLGCRAFSGEVPFRSRFGNSLTRLVFHYFSGRKVSDTQTGLRAFPASLFSQLLALPGERYEYEMTVLAYINSTGIPIVEVPIETIYIDGNGSSSFNPLCDSMRIYFILIRFYASSLVSAGLDLLFFSIVWWATHQLLAAVMIGRLSSIVNFLLNRTLVFRSQASVPVALSRYYVLAILLAAISYGSIKALSFYLGWNVVVIKVLVETLLSLLSFSAQRTFVFLDESRA
ncbi:MAG TPA: bifunctional glycosyltransferase family 2/GtrA family protein [Acidobacteriaceae bacterium]|nr:bifunctional glycosyltransferase family 2/GtrA family protein [Acidobacteriaceae bacterium]